MQLVSVTHVRCGEWTDRNYVLAPDEWDSEKIQEKVNEAKDLYLKEMSVALELKTKEAKKGGFSVWGPGPRPKFEDYPDMTVSEVLFLHKQRQEDWKKWSELQRNNDKPYEFFLHEVGFVRLDDNKEAEHIKCDWGHRHGTRIDIFQELIEKFPTPQELADGKREDDDW